MQKHIKIGALGVMLVAAAAVAWWVRPPSFLPLSRPTGLVIEWREGGGMIPDGSYAMITEGASYQEFDSYTSGTIQKTRKDFQVSGDEMDVLYTKIRSEAFDTIRESSAVIYDGSNASVRISAPSEFSYEIYGMHVRALDSERYRRVYEAIQQFLAKKASK